MLTALPCKGGVGGGPFEKGGGRRKTVFAWLKTEH